MAINFPDSPTTGQIFTSGSTSWIYDGVKWGLNTNIAVSNDSMPVGSILWFANTSTTPPGWLPADGSAVSRTTYATLFVVVGTTYGAGDGSTTFNVPSVAATTGKYFIRYTTSLGTVTTTSLSTAPVGTMLDWPVTSSYPTGYLRADGTAVSRTSYADLFALIDTTYGIGDNSTTFNLPNLVAAGSGSPVKIIKASLGGTIEPSTVAHAATHTQGGSDVISVTLNQVPNYQSNRNVLINGDFTVWQRGTTVVPTASQFFSSDRWESFRSALVAGLTVTRVTGTGNFPYAARVQRDSGNTSTQPITFGQVLETINSYKFASKPVTLSFWARAGSNLSSNVIANISTGTTVDGNLRSGNLPTTAATLTLSSLTTSWQFFSFTASSVSASLTQISSSFYFVPVGTAGANDYFEITGVQLEAGTTATPYEFEPYETTLRKCQRYYEVFGFIAVTGLAYNNLFYSTRKRVPGVVTLLTGAISPATFNPRDTNYCSLDGNPSVNAGNTAACNAEL